MSNWKSLMACVTVAAVLFGAVWTRVAAQPPEKRAAPSDGGKEPGKDPAVGKSAPSAKKSATFKVEKKPFKIELVVKGVVEPAEMTWIAFHPEPTAPHPQGPLTVSKVAEHGASVRKGDLLAAFDTRRLDQAIHQLEAETKILDANIKLAEVEQPLLEKAVPIDLESAERAKSEADEDLAYFLKTARPETEKRAQFYVKVAAFYLEYAKEQLRQLEKMYKVNDLTEETEQIILKRQRFMVEYEMDYYRLALIYRDFVLKTELPRREKALREGVIRQDIALEKARTTLAPMIAQKLQSLLKMRFDRARNQSSLDMLRADRKAMTITAPMDGLVYYGKFSKGQWETSGVAGKLVPEGSINPGEVFMTIMKPPALFVRVHIDEKDVHLVKVGLQGKAHMVFNPERKLAATVTKMSSVPAAPGKFEALVALGGVGADGVVPGMACSLKFVPYSQKLAVVVPSSAVFEEDDANFVSVMDKKGKLEQRRVTPGRANETHTEILEGLREGEEVVLRPKSTEEKEAKD